MFSLDDVIMRYMPLKKRGSFRSEISEAETWLFVLVLEGLKWISTFYIVRVHREISYPSWIDRLHSLLGKFVEMIHCIVTRSVELAKDDPLAALY